MAQIHNILLDSTALETHWSIFKHNYMMSGWKGRVGGYRQKCWKNFGVRVISILWESFIHLFFICLKISKIKKLRERKHKNGSPKNDIITKKYTIDSSLENLFLCTPEFKFPFSNLLWPLTRNLTSLSLFPQLEDGKCNTCFAQNYSRNFEIRKAKHRTRLSAIGILTTYQTVERALNDSVFLSTATHEGVLLELEWTEVDHKPTGARAPGA